ncbi:GTP cyclohydrolase II [Paenibacillus sp. CF384]|uniref:GTP cyclohydrolase II n=1 Tax=Paenibacillus sp. CF384 TaxID=1884382 RepID=UPI000894E25F|nr:GTP cyclohydrolase II [Paenibacillus sp. CF384]SDW47515.1 GTP cyclohydrolase II [Paenibacillus sp. CF384]
MNNYDEEVVLLLQDKVRLIPSGRTSIYLVGPIKMPINLQGKVVDFTWYSWLKGEETMGNITCMIDRLSRANLAELQQSSVLVYGDIQHAEQSLIRFHSICHTGDIFGSKRCDCGYQLKQSMAQIVDHGHGALFYLANHEGRGIGLFSKAIAYILQENGYDTVDANLKLGFVDDARDYGDAIEVLKTFRTKPVTLITNNPRKLEALLKAGMSIRGRVPLWGDVSEYNEKYLKTKMERSGHLNSRGDHKGLFTLN